MIEDKQIKELAATIYENRPAGLFEEDAEQIAELVINKQGYCKASEIFEAVDNLLELVATMTGMEFTYIGKYAELKKKYSGKDINVPTKEDTKTCEGCCNIAFRYPSADLYPCNCCSRAHQKDYYNIPVED